MKLGSNQETHLTNEIVNSIPDENLYILGIFSTSFKKELFFNQRLYGLFMQLNLVAIFHIDTIISIAAELL